MSCEYSTYKFNGRSTVKFCSHREVQTASSNYKCINSHLKRKGTCYKLVSYICQAKIARRRMKPDNICVTNVLRCMRGSQSKRVFSGALGLNSTIKERCVTMDSQSEPLGYIYTSRLTEQVKKRERLLYYPGNHLNFLPMTTDQNFPQNYMLHVWIRRATS
ncbi:hypothetical protein TNCV_1964601 [Trichonephila clavipes]|nr:hypothetical protein TNCV_1964601 [Trichonephila clavipes]